MTPYSNYPSQLDPIRQGILSTLALDAAERQKLQTCRYKSHCHSSYCPHCLQQAGYRQQKKVFKAASQIPSPRLRFATFKSADVPLEALRDAGETLVKAGRSTLKKLKVPDYALRLETSYPAWSLDFHPHLHSILSTAPGGRNYIAPAKWESAWLAELPSWLHPVQGTHIETVRDLQQSSSYLTKPLFADYAESTGGMVERIVNGITATKGITTFSVRGAFAA
jgi:hypothetical protein